MKRLLCFLGFHEWYYYREVIKPYRISGRCYKRQFRNTPYKGGLNNDTTAVNML